MAVNVRVFVPDVCRWMQCSRLRAHDAMQLVHAPLQFPTETNSALVLQCDPHGRQLYESPVGGSADGAPLDALLRSSIRHRCRGSEMLPHSTTVYTASCQPGQPPVDVVYVASYTSPVDDGTLATFKSFQGALDALPSVVRTVHTGLIGGWQPADRAYWHLLQMQHALRLMLRLRAL